MKIGEENSTDYVCTPFKHILGDYVEALERGADVLVQVTGFCRLNYYGELAEMILRDMGYTDFDMLNFSYVSTGKIRDYVAYCKKVVNPQLSVARGVKNLFAAYKMVEYIDRIRERYLADAGFEVERGSFERVRRQFLARMNAATSLADIEAGYRAAVEALDVLPLDKPADPVRVAIVGEYYTAQDPTSNLDVEQKLLGMGVELANYMSISNFNLHYNAQATRASITDYSRHDMGPTSSFNIAAAKRAAEAGVEVEEFGAIALTSPRSEANPHASPRGGGEYTGHAGTLRATSWSRQTPHQSARFTSSDSENSVCQVSFLLAPPHESPRRSATACLVTPRRSRSASTASALRML